MSFDESAAQLDTLLAGDRVRREQLLRAYEVRVAGMDVPSGPAVESDAPPPRSAHVATAPPRERVVYRHRRGGGDASPSFRRKLLGEL